MPQYEPFTRESLAEDIRQKNPRVRDRTDDQILEAAFKQKPALKSRIVAPPPKPGIGVTMQELAARALKAIEPPPPAVPTEPPTVPREAPTVPFVTPPVTEPITPPTVIPEVTEPRIVPARPKTAWEKVTRVFKMSNVASTAKARNILDISEKTGIQPAEVEKNYSKLIRDPEVIRRTGMHPSQPATQEMVMTALVAPIVASAVAHPATTIAGLAAFAGLDYLVPTEKFIPTDASDTTRSAIEMVDFIAKAAATGGVLKVGSKAIPKFTRAKLTEYKLPTEVRLTKTQTRDIFQTGRLTTAEQKELWTALDMTKPQIRKALREGIDISVPAEKIVTIADRPWFSKVKSVLGLKPDVQVFRELATRPGIAPKALLPAPTKVIWPKVGTKEFTQTWRTATEAQRNAKTSLEQALILKELKVPEKQIMDFVLNKVKDGATLRTELLTGLGAGQDKAQLKGRVQELIKTGEMLTEAAVGPPDPITGFLEREVARPVVGPVPPATEITPAVRPNMTSKLVEGQVEKPKNIEEMKQPPLPFPATEPTPDDVLVTLQPTPIDRDARIREMEERVDKSIGDVTVPVGMAVEVVEKPAAPIPKVKFSSPDTEQRYQAAKAGITKEGIAAQMGDYFTTLWYQISRDIYYRLPRTAEFARIRNGLLYLQKQKEVSQDKAIRALQGITLDFSQDELDLFTRKVLLDDLRGEAERGHALPFKFTPETVKTDSAKVDKAVTPRIKKALESRKAVTEAIKDNYIEAQEAIGHHVRDRFKNEAYYRHQVLEYANMKATTGIGLRLQVPTGRGFLRKRVGSELDINVNYIEAEFEYLSQMLYDTEVAKILKIVKDGEISGRLKGEARAANESALQEITLARPEVGQTMDQFRMRFAEAFQNIEGLARTGEIPAELYGKWERVITGLAQKAEIDDMVGSPDAIAPSDPDLWKFLADLANTEGKAGIWAKSIFKTSNAKRDFVQRTLGENYKEWQDMLPAGYELWQPRQGNLFYTVDSIPERLAKQLTQKLVETVGVTEKDLHRVLSIGNPRTAFAIKTELAETLNDMVPLKQDSGFMLMLAELQRLWKINVLISPRRVIRYNVRNLTGDADATFVGNPGAFRKMGKAMTELYPALFSYRTMAPEVRQWHQRGGFQTLLRAQEIGDLNDLQVFNSVYEKGKDLSLARIPLNAFKKYWEKARLTTDYREAILRYAAYLDYLEQLQAKKLKNYGASIPEEIDALPDNRDKAFKLANELLGAYDEISYTGQMLRKYIFPFWSWKEVNMKRYIQFFKNAKADGKAGETTGRMFRAKVPIVTARLTAFMIKATAFWTALQVWNRTMHPEEEKELNEFQKSRAHFVYGRDKQGRVLYFGGLGALGDNLAWFGLDEAPRYAEDWVRGKLSLREIGLETAKAPVNIFVQGISPVYKYPAEIASDQVFFPDVFNPRRMRNKGQYFFRQLALGNEFNALTKYPSRGYLDSLKELLWYRTDPGQGAYNDIWSLKRRYLKRRGREFAGFASTPKSAALYKYKLAIRYDDKELEERYMRQYQALGGTPGGMWRSLGSMHPLSGLSVKESGLFQATLDTEDERRLDEAVKYYFEVLRGEKPLTK